LVPRYVAGVEVDPMVIFCGVESVPIKTLPLPLPLPPWPVSIVTAPPL
jgi:hypothetical protein